MDAIQNNLLREGVLLKWTNYLSGWQPRWFRLEGGTLSYYHSQAEVGTCTRGSLQLCFCEMAISQTDVTRFDLTIPGEQYFYLKAPTPQERQLWILAIVKSKTVNQESARILGNKSQSGETSPFTFRSANAMLIMPPSMLPSSLHSTSTSASNENDAMDFRELENKRGELRVYRDSIVCQMAQIRELLKQDSVPDMERVNEHTGLVVATCNTFLHALDECMRLAGASRAGPPSDHFTMTTTTPSMVLSTSLDYAAGSALFLNINPKDGNGSTEICSVAHNDRSGSGLVKGPSTSRSESELSKLYEPPRPLDPASLRIGSMLPTSGQPIRCRTPSAQRAIRTFFSNMSVSFEDICLDTEVTAEGEKAVIIPTVQFLDACRCFVALFDCFNSSAFAPIKSDMLGNVQFVQQKYFLNPRAFHTLQGIIRKEAAEGVATELTSATNSLLWLKRGLSYLREFLKEILKAGLYPPTDSLVPYLSVAYESTLRPHHNWVVRGVVALAIRAMPYRSTFMKVLVPDVDNSLTEVKKMQLFRDIEHITGALEVLLDIIDTEFHQLGLPR